ncbi:hypothetical protein, partial [Aeromonas jandaei]|uniref:hypothetical protein n=1 Tax=Aeromonas jandaei TaxID=650 RepID=UPI002B055280
QYIDIRFGFIIGFLKLYFPISQPPYSDILVLSRVCLIKVLLVILSIKCAYHRYLYNGYFVGTILKVMQWKLVVVKLDRSEWENKFHFKWLYIHVEVMV